MALEDQHNATLASRKEFLLNYIDKLCEEYYGDKNDAMLPKFVKVKIPPIQKDEKFKKAPIQDGDFYLSIYNEIFLNTEGNVFDRNRLYGALGRKFSPKLKMEFGYMNQFLGNSNRDQINIGVFYNF